MIKGKPPTKRLKTIVGYALICVCGGCVYNIKQNSTHMVMCVTLQATVRTV